MTLQLAQITDDNSGLALTLPADLSITCLFPLFSAMRSAHLNPLNLTPVVSASTQRDGQQIKKDADAARRLLRAGWKKLIKGFPRLFEGGLLEP
jgi:hypothetical protein